VGVGKILSFSTGAGPGAGDAYTRPAPTLAPHPLFKTFFIEFYNLISISTNLF